MLQQFTVKNFRGFRNLTIQPLARVNLIAGKNNTGKTALLEALHIHAYPRDCGLPFSVNDFRSLLGDFRGSGTVPRFDMDAGHWLAYDRNPAPGIELFSEDDKRVARALLIRIVDAATAQLQYPDLGKQLVGSAMQGRWESNVPRIILAATVDGQTHYAAGFQEALGGLFGFGGHAPWSGPSIFVSSAGRSQEEDAKTFSELDAADRQDEILPSLRILEPRLERLSILFLGENPVIHGNIGLSRLVPMSFMGEGIRRLLSILLAISTAREGNVLIDEIENGLHHSVLKQVWQAVGHAARQANVQVFATTHSYECIQAAHQAFQESEPYDLRLFRLDRVNSEIRVATYNQHTLETAIDMSLEVR